MLDLKIVIFQVFLLCPVAMPSIIIPMKQLLDYKCTTTLIVQPGGQDMANALLNDVSYGETSGIILNDEKSPSLSKSNKIRSTWSCFDVIVLFDKNAITDPTLLTRNAKYIYIKNNLNSSMEFPIRQGSALHEQTIVFLAPIQSPMTYNLWLFCPPERESTGPRKAKLINSFSTQKRKWISNSYQRRKSYRLCNGAGFYHGKTLIYTGRNSKGITRAPIKLAEIIAQSLGAKFKLKHSRGCLGLQNKLPKPKNALGFLYYNKADIGGNSALGDDINQLFDYMFYGFVEYYFVGPKPKMLSQFRNITYTFDNITWLILCISLVSITFLCIIIQLKEKSNDKMKSILLILGMIFMEHHFALFRKRPLSGVLLRNIWLVTVTLLAMAYQGTLKASLTKRTYEKNIKTHWDMLDQNLPVYTFTAKGFTGSMQPDYYHKLYTHVIKLNTNIKNTQHRLDILDKIFNGEDAFIFSSILSDVMYKNLYRTNYGSTGYPLTRITERFSYEHNSFVVKKFLPQTDEILSKLRHLKSSGITNNEFNKYDFYLGKKEAVVKDREKISNEHFLIIYIIILLSYICGFVMFLWEIRRNFILKADNRIYGILLTEEWDRVLGSAKLKLNN